MSLGNVTDKISKRFYPAVTYTQTSILGLYNEANDNYNLLRHILLIFKYDFYISREKRILNIDILITNLIKVKKNLIIHCENHTGWVGREFFCLFICLYACFDIFV